jgi:hypothetical protein
MSLTKHFYWEELNPDNDPDLYDWIIEIWKIEVDEEELWYLQAEGNQFVLPTGEDLENPTKPAA